ncbi:MAG: carboxypeptidase-like regulatory domain-containing protein [Candidatus Latescibacteria bacterium]|nr:carboxypeptidase-like regulatory domain-containing protein [Candidatus Latescibacterota bacterium]
MFAFARAVPFLLIFLCFPFQVSAQQLGRLLGTVRDAETGEPLPSANIRVLDSTLGTISNSEGSYRLVLEPGFYRIAFGYMGYYSDTLRVAFGTETMQMDISLRPAILKLPDVIIRPGAGDPAEDLIREAIARKQAMLETLRSYRFDAYTRTKISIPRKDEEGEWLEIISLLETQTRGYWKAPDNYLETITARRQSSTFSATQNIFTAGRLPNFIRDRVIIGSNNVPTPLASSALKHYRYSIIDTTMAVGRKVYRLHVEPKTQTMPLFTGTIAIAEGSYLLVSVDLNGNEAMNSRPLNEWHLQQQFAAYEGMYWLPIDSRMRFTVDIGIQRPAYMDLHSVLYDYGINEDLPPSLFGRYELNIEPAADVADSTIWEGLQRLPLTNDESAAFERIEREWEQIGSIRRFAIGVLTSQLGQSNSSFTESSDFFHHNRVEGLYLGAGLAFREPIPLTRLMVKGGYGFADRQWKYGLEVERALFRVPEISFGAGVERAVVYREGLRVYTPNRISRLTLLYNTDPVDYYMRRGWSAWFRLKPWSTLDMRLLYQNKLHSSVKKNTNFSLLYPTKRYRDNTSIVDGRLNCVVMTLDLDTKKYLRAGESDLEVEGENTWRVLGELELTEGPLWHSDFSYMRAELLVTRHQYTFGSGFLDLTLRGGGATGELPPQRLFDLYGGAGGAYQPGVFMSLDAGEFVGDIYTMLWVEHNFGTMPLRAIGIRPRDQLDIDIIVHGCVGACGLEGANADSLASYGGRATDGLHWEVGFGLARLLTFLRLDFTWRLTHLGRRNLVISIGTAFRL